MDEAASERVDPAKAGLRGHCPRCGRGRLFAGLLRMQARCEECGLDFRSLEQADGPAFFVMTIVGILIVGLALWLELSATPPFWLHLLLWPVVALLISLPLLRLGKGLMAGLQYRSGAAEGRLDRGDGG